MERVPTPAITPTPYFNPRVNIFELILTEILFIFFVYSCSLTSEILAVIVEIKSILPGRRKD